jgi:hypothetical protein
MGVSGDQSSGRQSTRSYQATCVERVAHHEDRVARLEQNDKLYGPLKQQRISQARSDLAHWRERQARVDESLES